MAQVRLQRPRVGALVRQHVARSMAQHVRMHLEGHLGLDPGPLDHLLQAGHCEGRAPLADEDEGRLGSRFSARSARSSSPSNGWVPVDPPLARAGAGCRFRTLRRSTAIRTALTPAGRAGSRSGSWRCRCCRGGCPWRPRSASRLRARSDAHAALIQRSDAAAGSNCPFYCCRRHQFEVCFGHVISPRGARLSVFSLQYGQFVNGGLKGL